MAIIGIGTDLVEIDRIREALERFGEAFYRRVLSEDERKNLPELPVRRAEYVAARFAAKEAVSKALGTGFSEGISMTEIEVRKDARNAPYLRLYGKAEWRSLELGVALMHISLTHAKEYAAAFVVLEK